MNKSPGLHDRLKFNELRTTSFAESGQSRHLAGKEVKPGRAQVWLVLLYRSVLQHQSSNLIGV